MKRLGLSMHNDGDYRLTDDAEDNWIGEISDSGGDMVLEMQALVLFMGWHRVRALAEVIVLAHNDLEAAECPSDDCPSNAENYDAYLHNPQSGEDWKYRGGYSYAAGQPD
jgi:hypothetical protein